MNDAVLFREGGGCDLLLVILTVTSFSVLVAVEPLCFLGSIPTPPQRQPVLVGARYATLANGTNRYSLETPAGVSKTVGQSIEEAAHRVGVGTSTIDRAKAIINKGVPELVAAVESGQVTVNAAAQVAKLPEHERGGADWG